VRVGSFSSVLAGFRRFSLREQEFERSASALKCSFDRKSLNLTLFEENLLNSTLFEENLLNRVIAWSVKTCQVGFKVLFRCPHTLKKGCRIELSKKKPRPQCFGG
jgi:hypothetical protein